MTVAARVSDTFEAVGLYMATDFTSIVNCCVENLHLKLSKVRHVYVFIGKFRINGKMGNFVENFRITLHKNFALHLMLRQDGGVGGHEMVQLEQFLDVHGSSEIKSE